MKKRTFFTMIICMIIVAFIYFFASGFFVVNSSLADVLSSSKDDTICQDKGEWSFMQPKDNNLTSYFIYSGEKYPTKAVALRGVFYIDNNGKLEERKIDVFLLRDKHYFLGESRWYLPEKYGKIEAAYCKIAYCEEPSGEIYYDYLWTNNLTQKQIGVAKQWVNDTEMNPNLITKH